MDQAYDEAVVMPDAAALEGVRNAVAEYNAARPRYEVWMWRRLYGVMGGYAVVAFVVVIWFINSVGDKDKFGAVLAGLFLVGALLYHLCMMPVRDFQQDLRNRLLPVIFGFIADVRYSKGTRPRFMDKFPKKALLKYGTASHDDAISGHYDGLSFMLSETKLKTGGKNPKTLFEGVMFHFYLADAFPGILAATKRATGMEKVAQDIFGTGNLRIIERGEPDSDQTHEFRTDDTTAALPLIRGPLVRALDYLARVWPDDAVRIALVGKECFLMVPARKNFFELPDIAHDIDVDRHILPMIRDIVTLLVTARLVSRINIRDETQQAG